MNKIKYIFILIMSISFLAHADEYEEEIQPEDGPRQLITSYMTDARQPKMYGQPFSNTIMQMFLENEFTDFLIDQQLSGEFNRAVEARKRLNHCHKFIQADGNPGEWGIIIKQALDRVPELRNELMTDDAATKAGMNLVCPRFAELNYEERKEFWVWTMTTLALFESTCGFDTSNASNTNAVGIYQLHASSKDRAPRALINNEVCGKLNSTQIAQPTNNIMCTLDFMRDSFSGRFEHAPAGLITKAQQFERLRSSTNSIIKVLQKFKTCQLSARRNS